MPRGRSGLFPGVVNIERILVQEIHSDDGGVWTDVRDDIVHPDLFPHTELEVKTRYGEGTYRLTPKRAGGAFCCAPRIVRLGASQHTRAAGQTPIGSIVNVLEANTSRQAEMWREMNRQTREDGRSQIEFIGSVLSNLNGGGKEDAFSRFLQAELDNARAEVRDLRRQVEELRDRVSSAESFDDPWKDLMHQATPRLLSVVDRAMERKLPGAGAARRAAGDGEKKALDAGVEAIIKGLPSVEEFRQVLASGYELGATDLARLWKLVRSGRLPAGHRELLAEYLGRWLAVSAPSSDAGAGDGVPQSGPGGVGGGGDP